MGYDQFKNIQVTQRRTVSIEGLPPLNFRKSRFPPPPPLKFFSRKTPTHTSVCRVVSTHTHTHTHTVQEADEQIIAAITALVKENVEVLGDQTRTAADGKQCYISSENMYVINSPLLPSPVQLEKDVKEALFAIAKQQGKIDPNVSVYILENMITR